MTKPCSLRRGGFCTSRRVPRSRWFWPHTVQLRHRRCHQSKTRNGGPFYQKNGWPFKRDNSGGAKTMSTLLAIDKLCVEYWGIDGSVRAVEGVSLDIRRGEIFGLAGESGSGKSTIGKAIMRICSPQGSLRTGRFCTMASIYSTWTTTPSESFVGEKSPWFFKVPSMH